MAAPDLTGNEPPSERSIERFDPKNLDRTVIAIPLLKRINEEKALVEKMREKYPDLAKEFNSVILLPRKNRVTSDTTRAAVQRLVDEALDSGGEQSLAFRSQHRLGGRFPGENGLFAWLDARTIRRILNRQDVRRSHDEKL